MKPGPDAPRRKGCEVKYAKSAVAVCGAALALSAAAPAGAVEPGDTSPDLSLDAAAEQVVEGLTNKPGTELLKQAMPVNGPQVRALTSPVDKAAHDVIQGTLAGETLVPTGLGPIGGS